MEITKWIEANELFGKQMGINQRKHANDSISVQILNYCVCD